MTTYIALLRKDPDSDFGVDFPDFQGCISAASTIDEAFVMAHEALQGHIQLMMEDGETIPEPSSLELIMGDPENAGSVPFLVNIALERSRVVRVNVTLPEDLVKQIDLVSKNRSRFLAEAARRALQAA
jgi:predicted RNase H-like HicB family nuclease